MSFHINLFRQIAAENPGNFFVSSTSIQAAMSIATAAAAGKTEKELASVLDMEALLDLDSYEVTHHIQGERFRNLRNDSLTIANRFWVNEEYDLKPAYCDLVSRAYDTKIGTLDVSDPENEAARVNRWVEKNTNDKIHDLISPDVINPDLLAILVNCIAYKGEWTTKFDKKDTRDEQFCVAHDQTVYAPRMSRLIECNYLFESGVQAIALDLENDIALVCVMPSARYDGEVNTITLDDVIATIDEGFINRVLDSYKNEVDVGLVKWKFEGTYPLIPTFKALGVNQVFDSRSDLSRMSDESVYISDILHKTFISVDEDGAEMVAATKVDFALECAFMRPSFVTDRPFIYFAVDRKSRTILFSGRVSDPTVSE